ncbi:hypothetical protein B0H17DRAFT_1332545 [Mycena rosella]|uniref:Myb-like domain-containing protein n=1 Tax=Mycena rosella TaxID=1033263 RepID=A0AAD7GEG2_MYCRO|nr:hypothetical protein B0H17DRAFT_1332545 [Mycena rosella]
MASGAPAPSASASTANALPARATFSSPRPSPPPLPPRARPDAAPAPDAAPEAAPRLARAPSSPRLVPAWHFRDDTSVAYARKGKVRRLAAASDDEDAEGAGEDGPAKKARRKWTQEETQMLVAGHGVGNWKAILSDPNLAFANRSPVDLKDRYVPPFVVSLFLSSFLPSFFSLLFVLHLVSSPRLLLVAARVSLARSRDPHKRRLSRVPHRLCLPAACVYDPAPTFPSHRAALSLPPRAV